MLLLVRMRRIAPSHRRRLCVAKRRLNESIRIDHKPEAIYSFRNERSFDPPNPCLLFNAGRQLDKLFQCFLGTIFRDEEVIVIVG